MTQYLGMQTLDRLCEFATRYTAAWCSGNPEAVAALFAPNGSLKINDGTPNVGRDAIAEVARSFMTAFPDMKVYFDGLKQNGGARIEFDWTLTGTNSGPGGTGKKVRISGFESWQFSADGLIQDSFGHFDAVEYGHQLEHGFQG
jgi:predicted ester cyclase